MAKTCGARARARAESGHGLAAAAHGAASQAQRAPMARTPSSSLRVESRRSFSDSSPPSLLAWGVRGRRACERHASPLCAQCARACPQDCGWPRPHHPRPPAVGERVERGGIAGVARGAAGVSAWTVGRPSSRHARAGGRPGGRAGGRAGRRVRVLRMPAPPGARARGARRVGVPAALGLAHGAAGAAGGGGGRSDWWLGGGELRLPCRPRGCAAPPARRARAGGPGRGP